MFFSSTDSKIKGCEALAQWIEPIRNHFWHSAETCDGDVTKLKVGISQTMGNNTCTLVCHKCTAVY